MNSGMFQEKQVSVFEVFVALCVFREVEWQAGRAPDCHANSGV